MRAVETRYKGYRFRSRLEARWAVFFDALSLEWQYEPEGYDIGALGWYLPDFSINIRGYSCLFEVKPSYPSKVEIEKARSVDAYILAGTPGVDDQIFSYVVVKPAMIGEDGRTIYGCNHYIFCGCRHCNNTVGLEAACFAKFTNTCSGDQKSFAYFDEGLFTCSCCHPDKDVGSNWFDETLVIAYTAARTARFEHGEQPISR